MTRQERKLFEAVKAGDLSAAEASLSGSWFSKGASVDARDEKGMTPLFHARTQQMAEFLLSRGADINAEDSEHFKPVFTVAFRPTFEANPRILEYLLQTGGDANAQGKGGFSALMAAAIMGNERECRILLAAHADANASNDEGLTPLMMAAIKGARGVVKCLLANGAESRLETKSGETAAALAEEHNHQDVADLIRGLASGRNGQKASLSISAGEVSKLEDRSLLASIICQHPSPNVRGAAVDQIYRTCLPAQIRSQAFFVGDCVVERDGQVLTALASAVDDSSSDVAIRAFENLCRMDPEAAKAKAVTLIEKWPSLEEQIRYTACKYKCEPPARTVFLSTSDHPR